MVECVGGGERGKTEGRTVEGQDGGEVSEGRKSSKIGQKGVTRAAEGGKRAAAERVDTKEGQGTKGRAMGGNWGGGGRRRAKTEWSR